MQSSSPNARDRLRGTVQGNGSYVVISRLPDRQTRMWLSLVSSQHGPVVVLAEGTGTDTGLPARTIDMVATAQ